MNKINRTFSLIFVFALSGSAFLTNVNAQFMQDPGRNLSKNSSKASGNAKTKLPGRTTSIFESKASAVDNELRAFDFADSFYSGYGIIPTMILDRHNGQNGKSVIETNASSSYSNVRVTETHPLSNAKGFMFFYAELGRLTDSSFVDIASQKNVVRMAEKYPIYAFPSIRAGNERQARIGDFGNEYFIENDLGVSIIVDVYFTDQAHTKAGHQYLASVLGANGMDRDGTFRIRTLEDVQDLTLAGYLTMRERTDSYGQKVYMIGKVFENPVLGGISSDAFLQMIEGADEKPLASEMNFTQEFDCLRVTGNWCGN